MQLVQVALLILLSQTATAAIGSYDYCKFKKCGSPGVKHTVCKTKCKKLHNSELVPQTFEFRKRVVAKHNEKRQLIASGQNTTGGNSKASNMMVMSYDMELEFVMSCWLVTLDMINHDKCRGTVKFPQAGQNLFYSTYLPSMAPPDGDAMVASFMDAYFDEIGAMTAAEVDKFDGGGHDANSMIGHFTQMIWASNMYIGCAITLVNTSSERRILQGCNFGPGGNMLTAKVYERGEPASRCPAGTKANKQYPALCGEIRAYEPEAHKTGNPGIKAIWGRGCRDWKASHLQFNCVFFAALLLLSK